MKTRVFLPVVAALFAALTLPTEVSAQSTNVKTPNKNQSAKFKSVIVKGSGNLIESNSIASFIGGGQSNKITLGVTNAVIGGGLGNVVSSNHSTTVGGFSNAATGREAFVGGGRENTASGRGSTVTGGRDNQATKSYSTVGGGEENEASGEYSLVGGGEANEASGEYSVVGGGIENEAYTDCSTVGGGMRNDAGGEYSVVGGGSNNQVYESRFGTVGGGAENQVLFCDFGTVGGGMSNTVRATNSTISGGASNTISDEAIGAVIGGGTRNTNNGINAVIPGGAANTVSGDNSFAAGLLANADHQRSFVWGDGTALTTSIGTNSFTVRATGGAKFFTAAGSQLNSPGPIIEPGGADWKSNSDSNLKTEVTAIDHRAVLAKLASMPVTSWQFKHDKARRYMGPMAQDFHAVFGLGSSDTTIGTLDADGVLFSSVKGLIEELKERDMAMAARDQTIEELKAELRTVKQRLDSLPPAP